MNGSNYLSFRSGSRCSQVAAALGYNILTGVYPAGSIVPFESQLLEQFSVSRPILREAIKLLEGKGMLERRQRRGTIVLPRRCWNFLDIDVLSWTVQSGSDPDILMRLTELRIIVEPGACQLAASAADEDALRRIEDAWEQMRINVDEPARFREADCDFHLAVLRATKNEYLTAVGTAISAAVAVSIQQTNPTAEANRATLVPHRRIIEALKRQDGVAAAKESRTQLQETMDLLRRHGRI